MFQLTSIALLLFITTAFNLVACWISWRRRNTIVGSYFAAGMLGVTAWTLAAGLDYAAVPISLKVFFAKLEYIGYNAAFLFFALFAICYAGYERLTHDLRARAILWFLPLSNMLLAWTNEWHGWLWSGFERSTYGDNIVIFHHGPGYLWAVVTGYLMILAIIVPLWQAARHGTEVIRRQARLLFYAALLTVAANLLYLFQPPKLRGVDWTSISFSISGILFLLALYGTRFLDIVPIARDQLVRGLSDSMIVLDMQHRIIDINTQAAAMMGSSASELVGRDLLDVAPYLRPYLNEAPGRELRRELESTGEGSRHFDVLAAPLHDDRHNIIGRLLLLRDITHRKHNELRLLQLTQAVEQSPASVMITDLRGNITYVNPQMTRLTGYTPEEVLGQNPRILQSQQTPDEVYREMWTTILAGQTWHGEFLNRKKNGELYWEDAVIAPVVGEAGQIISFLAVKVDITPRKQTESALRVSEERFRQLVMSAPDAVFGVESDGRIVFANREAAKLLGYEESELIGQSIEILVPEALRGRHVEHRAGYAAEPRTRAMGGHLELIARCKDGSGIPVEINLSQSLTEKGPLVIAHMRDITRRRVAEDALRDANRRLASQLSEIEKLQSTLREQALRDPLTQVHNRRFLNESLDKEFHHARRTRESLSVILLDIDHFKSINDTYGHAVGDACLIALVRRLERHIRRSDLFCRYGGEEFMLVLPATDLVGASSYADKLRLLVANEALRLDHLQIRLTISLGVACFPLHGNTSDEIIDKADEAMYISKRSGRNRVTVWFPSLPRSRESKPGYDQPE